MVVTYLFAVMKIEVHHLSKDPTAAWSELSKTQKVIKVQVSQPKSNVADDKVGCLFADAVHVAVI
jgi:hypothetical protein